MNNKEKPQYLITNPVFSEYKIIPTQKEYDFYVDILGDFKADRITVPLKLFRFPKSTEIKDYLALRPFLK
tara:strand:- start:585 stop:794 length:210 start_codon:yes stop_codon:yes gene_type:complete